MADTKNTDNTVVAPSGDHDQVAMLSIAKDGTPDQHDPEIIGDKEFAIEATKRQFAERAAAAVDAEKRPELGLAPTPDEVVEDKSIGALKKAQDSAIAAAEKQAEALVNKLHKG